MAKQTVGIGTSANDGTGDALRVAFDKLNDNFDEVYADDFVTNARIANDAVDTDQIADDAVDSAQIADGAIDTVHIGNDQITNAKIADNQIDSEHYVDGSIDTAHLSADSVDGTKIADDSIDSEHYVDGSIDTAHIADDQITHDKLEARYTTKGSITTYTGAVSVDWSTATNFVMGSSLTGAIEFDFTNFKTGQVLTIHNLTGSQTITLDSDAATSETFNKVGGNDYDGASTNVLIVECIDDSATAVFNYSILTYTSDTTP